MATRSYKRRHGPQVGNSLPGQDLESEVLLCALCIGEDLHGF